MDEIYMLIRKLKSSQRQGWVQRGLNSDSIAEQVFGTVLIGWHLAEEEGVDKNKVVEMLLVHDLIMAEIEDLTPESGDYKNKRTIENENKHNVARLFPSGLNARYLELFDEFNSHNTKESMVAREADKLETLYQAEVYEVENSRSDIINEFLEQYKKYFKTKTGKKYFNRLVKRARQRKSATKDNE